MTTTRTIVVGVLAVVLASTACKDKGGKKKPDDNNAAAPMSADLKGVLGMMPLSSEAVIGVDFAALRGTAVYKQHEGQLKGLAASQLELISKLCDFDPTKEIGSVIFAGKGKTKGGDMTALIRGVPKARLMDCLTKGAASPPEGFTISVDGDYALVETVPGKPLAGDGAPADDMPPVDKKMAPEPADAGAAPAATDGGAPAPAPAPKKPQSVSLKFLDDTTLLVARRKGVGVTGKELDAIAAGQEGDTIVEQDVFMALIDGTDTDAPVWFVVSGSAPMLKAAAKYIAFDAAFGSVRVGDGIDLDLTARMVDDKAAKDVSSLLIRTFDNLKKSTLREAIGPNQVTVTGRDTRVTLHESGEQLQMLVAKGRELAMALLGAVLGQ